MATCLTQSPYSSFFGSINFSRISSLVKCFWTIKLPYYFQFHSPGNSSFHFFLVIPLLWTLWSYSSYHFPVGPVQLFSYQSHWKASMVAQWVKESACNAGDLGSIPGLGRSPREGNGNPLQCSCLENPLGKDAWQAAVHRVTQRWTQLID